MDEPRWTSLGLRSIQHKGDEPEFKFTFVNNGSEPMIISNAKGSCGCTVPKWPKEPIPPKELVKSVSNLTQRIKRSTKKTVTLTANTTPPTTKLRVTGMIEVNE